MYSIIGIVVLCVVITPVAVIKRRRSRRAKAQEAYREMPREIREAPKETPDEWIKILKLRLAKGEITEEEYEKMKKKLKEA